MAGVLGAERVWVEAFTGLRVEQFGRLLKAVRERGGEGCGWGRPWRLPLAERVLLVAVYYRTNLTMQQLAPLVEVSPATVCRVIQRLDPLLALKPVRAPQDATERLWIVDGTLIPVRDRRVGTSSRNYRFSANVQVIEDADTRLVVAAARPVPVTTADAKAWRDSGLAEHCQRVTVLSTRARTIMETLGHSTITTTTPRAASYSHQFGSRLRRPRAPGPGAWRPYSRYGSDPNGFCA
ncbi:transposase family protein [Streptomyces sp. NPDC056291]|uniref:transposase family protein n=1 Tax=Streptomyces sp. NPDC056291 TaxID=3345772 RepID=UPI0035D53E9D